MSDQDRYLDAMGITQWQPRADSEVKSELESVIEPVVESQDNSSSTIGLNWLNTGCRNGLLVILPEQRSKLTPEQRSLMSKMLNSIRFLPKETGFATVNKSSDVEKQVSFDSVTAILAFGHDAGKDLVQICDAKSVPGTEFFLLHGVKVVSTLHPQDLLSEPSLKQQAWKDLQQLASLFNH